MGPTFLAQDFGALHTQAIVLLECNAGLRSGLEKAGPPRAGIKLGA